METGLSATVLKTISQRLPTKISYSNFDNGMFQACLFNASSKEDVGNLEKFIKVCINKLNNYAPSKKRYSKGNNLPFMKKAIMNQTRLRDAYLRKRSEENSSKYSKQRNYCVWLLTRTKRIISAV